MMMTIFNSKYFIGFIIGVLLSITLYFVFNPSQPDYNYQDELREINRKYDSLKMENLKIDTINQVLFSKLDSLDSIISKQNLKLSQIKNETNKQILIIDTFNSNELYEYISNRYSDSIR